MTPKSLRSRLASPALGRVAGQLVALALALAPAAPLVADDPKPQKWAVLVGVDEYAEFEKLEFAGADQRALAAELVRLGFPADQLFILNDKAEQKKYLPFRENIEKQLDLVLGVAGPDDLVIVAFSGHGVHLDGKSYLCPSEASLGRPAQTMLPLDDVYARLARCRAALKLLFVDACRNDPRPGGARSARAAGELTSDFLGSLERPPEGLLVMTSCAPRQVSLEEREFGHGVFTHFLIEGLHGKAANAEGVVSLGALYDYASMETKKYAIRKRNEFQTPALWGKITGPFEIAHLDRSRPAPDDLVPRATPVKHGEVITNTIGMKLKLIPAGQFVMGSSETRDDLARSFELYDDFTCDDERPRHRVQITRPFYLGVYEVTLGEFLKFYHEAGYKARWNSQGNEQAWGLKWEDGEYEYEDGPQYVPWSWGHPDQTERHPVVDVSWNDAVAFCEWLSRKEGKRYRLPTEAEWEYACRAGTTSRFYNCYDEEQLIHVGNVADSQLRKALGADWSVKESDGYVLTAPVGKFAPNGFGLYDMIGNASEWCSDWYDEEYYAHSRERDPQGPAAGSYRVLRGSGWAAHSVECRCAFRNYDDPANRNGQLGFRVVCER